MRQKHNPHDYLGNYKVVCASGFILGQPQQLQARETRPLQMGRLRTAEQIERIRAATKASWARRKAYANV